MPGGCCHGEGEGEKRGDEVWRSEGQPVLPLLLLLVTLDGVCVRDLVTAAGKVGVVVSPE